MNSNVLEKFKEERLRLTRQLPKVTFTPYEFPHFGICKVNDEIYIYPGYFYSVIEYARRMDILDREQMIPTQKNNLAYLVPFGYFCEIVEKMIDGFDARQVEFYKRYLEAAKKDDIPENHMEECDIQRYRHIAKNISLLNTRIRNKKKEDAKMVDDLKTLVDKIESMGWRVSLQRKFLKEPILEETGSD